MTRDEAKSVLFDMLGKGIYVKNTKENQAILAALRALEQKPCEDWYDVPSYEMTLEQARQAVKDLRKMWAEHLWQEPCEDAISRQAVLDGVDRYIYKSQSTGTQDDFYSFAELVVKQLPSVTPQPKAGHWEWVQYDYNPRLGNWHCSECRCVVVECVDENEKGGIPLYKYCPQCGARMVEPQESEDKE